LYFFKCSVERLFNILLLINSKNAVPALYAWHYVL
jgi:hypothetical protein